MAKLGITQLEQATTIPDGSLHLVEMGDGSGTKAVTQEILAKETGKALKVGNPEDLQTKDKTSIVAAINEVAQSGGSGGGDILDSKEEIEANTETGKVAGAAAVKEMFSELNDNLKGFEPIIDPETGQITGYKTTIGGADTVFPFSSNIDLTNMVACTSPFNVESGKKYLICVCQTNGYSVSKFNFSGCTVEQQSSIVNTSSTSSRSSWMEVAIVTATSNSISISVTESGSGASSSFGILYTEI